LVFTTELFERLARLDLQTAVTTASFDREDKRVEVNFGLFKMKLLVPFILSAILANLVQLSLGGEKKPGSMALLKLHLHY
jgi:hypothetical protein